jgi:hypothetical protein
VDVANVQGGIGMDMAKVTTILSLIIALSVASERLVEIVKGMVPWLDQPRDDPAAEGRRRSVLQVMALASGVFTAWLASPALPSEIWSPGTGLLDQDTSGKVMAIGALGLLASGGSGFWNSILTYVGKVKETKAAEADVAKAVAEERRVSAPDGIYPELHIGTEQVTSNECYDVKEA